MSPFNSPQALVSAAVATLLLAGCGHAVAPSAVGAVAGLPGARAVKVARPAATSVLGVTPDQVASEVSTYLHKQYPGLNVHATHVLLHPVTDAATLTKGFTVGFSFDEVNDSDAKYQSTENGLYDPASHTVLTGYVPDFQQLVAPAGGHWTVKTAQVTGPHSVKLTADDYFGEAIDIETTWQEVVLQTRLGPEHTGRYYQDFHAGYVKFMHFAPVSQGFIANVLGHAKLNAGVDAGTVKTAIDQLHQAKPEFAVN